MIRMTLPFQFNSDDDHRTLTEKSPCQEYFNPNDLLALWLWIKANEKLRLCAQFE